MKQYFKQLLLNNIEDVDLYSFKEHKAIKNIEDVELYTKLLLDVELFEIKAILQLNLNKVTIDIKQDQHLQYTLNIKNIDLRTILLDLINLNLNKDVIITVL